MKNDKKDPQKHPEIIQNDHKITPKQWYFRYLTVKKLKILLAFFKSDQMKSERDVVALAIDMLFEVNKEKIMGLSQDTVENSHITDDAMEKVLESK